MRKFGGFLLLTGVAIFSICSITFADTWKEDQSGWYWQEDSGNYPTSSWKWLDGNQDGISECYYFDSRGYLITNTITPDGCQVDADGRWNIDGKVQIQISSENAATARQMYDEAVKKTLGLVSYEGKNYVELSVSGNGKNYVTKSDIDYLVKDLNSPALKLQENVRTIDHGENQILSGFYFDNYLYIDEDGQKSKTIVDFEEMSERIIFTSECMLQKADDIEQIWVTTDEDGNRVLEFNCSQNANFVGWMDMVDLVSWDFLFARNLKMHDYSGALIVNQDGYILSSDIRLHFDATPFDKDSGYDAPPSTYFVRINANYINPGQPVDFVLPSNTGF